MQSISFSPFSITLNSLGNFQRKDSYLYWRGIKESQQLTKLYQDLKYSLSKASFSTENRPYYPHLTLGREIFLNLEQKNS